MNPSSSIQIQRGVDASTKLLYRKGAKIVEKMGYQGSGGLGPSGEGVWLPPQPPAVAPKHGQKLGLGHGDQSSTQSIPSTLDSS